MALTSDQYQMHLCSNTRTAGLLGCRTQFTLTEKGVPQHECEGSTFLKWSMQLCMTSAAMYGCS